MENTSSENGSSSTFLKQWISTSMDLSQNSVDNLLSHDSNAFTGENNSIDDQLNSNDIAHADIQNSNSVKIDNNETSQIQLHNVENNINTIQTESIHAISQDHNFNSLKIASLQNQPECIDIDEEFVDHNDDSLNVNHVKTIDGQPECISIDKGTQDHIVIQNITSLTVDEADGKATADTSMEIENSSQTKDISEEVHMDVETNQNGEANVLESSQNEDTESEKQIQIVNYSSNTFLMEKEVEIHPNEAFEEMVDVESMDYVESAGENDAVKETADSLQANESEAVHDDEIEIIQEKSRNVVVDNISICSSDSSDEEFASTIENIVSEAFKNEDSQSEKIPDTIKETAVPPQNTAVNTTATIHEIVLSDDEDFDKVIEDAVQEVFTGNDGTSEKNNETPNKDTPLDTAIDEHSSASQDEMAYDFLRKKIKLEKDVTSSTERDNLENFDGEHAFTITVSFIDNKDSVNHAVYSESRNKLYVNKDYEFQVLCSSMSVPPNSFLKTCVYFDDPSQHNFIVKRCAVHYRSERSNGNRMHVIRTTHPEARYEKDPISKRYYVAIPYQSSLKTSQGGAELYCYTYKFACYSSCFGVKQRNFKVKFTLENGEKQLGRQVIDVKVCKFPEKEMSAEEKKPEEEKIPEERTSEVDEEADSEEECPSENENVPRKSSKKSSGVILLIEHFLIPALNSEKYGRLLFWGDQPNVFFIKWKHKASTTWSEDELAVFKDWDDLKGRSENVFDDQEMVTSKQRLRAAFRLQKKLVEMESEVEDYKKYKILSSTYLKVRRSQRDRAAMPDDKIPSPNKSLPESRNTSVRAHEPVSYEETVDFDEEKEDEIPVREPPKKKLKTSPAARKPYFRKKMNFNPKKGGKKNSVRAKPGPKPKLRAVNVTESSSFAVSGIQKLGDGLKKNPVRAKPGPKPKLRGVNVTESSSLAVSGIQKLGDGLKKGNLVLEARVELQRLTVQDLLKAKVKRKVIEKYYGKIKSPTKPRSRAQPDKIKVDYSPKINLVSSNLVPPVPPTSQTVFQNQAINFQATPYQVPAVPPLMSMPMMERKDDEKPKLLNTYNNIKTQGDMIEAMIKAALPTLQGDKVSEIYNFLVEMGVENVEDLAFIEVDDMNRILKPVQSRKLIAAWKNKGVSSYGSNQTSVPEPVTFVPAVFQIQNMPDNKVYQVFHTSSSDNSQNTLMHSINIPGWQQKNAVQPYVQDVRTDCDSEPKSKTEPVHSEAPLPPPEPNEWNPDTFEIPWHKVPPRIMELLSKKKRPDRKDHFELIHVITDDIFKVSERPTLSEMEIIGTKMMKKFPQSLCDEKSRKNCKKLVGQLLNRFKFLRVLKKGGKLDSLIEEVILTDSPKTSQQSKLERILSSPLNPATTSSMSLCASEASNASVIPKLPPIEMPDKAWTPPAQDIISLSTSKSSSSNLNFRIPWHKMDYSLLNTLNQQRWLTTSQKQALVEFVIDEYFLWNPNSENLSEDAEMIAQQMCKIYPLSLTDKTFAVGGGSKYSSVALTRLLELRGNLISALKANQPSTSKQTSSMDNHCVNPLFQNWGRSSLPDNKSALPTVSSQHEFPIPWHKLDTSILNCLQGNSPLSYKDRVDLVKTVCTDYIHWPHKSTNVSEDTRNIARQMCEIYPAALSNTANGIEGGKTESSHLAELLRICVHKIRKTSTVFPIPWHKLDASVLQRLGGNEPLSQKDKEMLLKTVCADYFQWEHRSSNLSEDARQIAKQMFEIYPYTLSNKGFGKPNGKTESSYLALSLRRKLFRMQGKRRKTSTVFPIPLNKVATSVLQHLEGNGPLPLKAKEELLNIVCADYLQWEYKSTNVSEDTRIIAKRLFEIYPLTLSNKAFGQENGQLESSHLADLLRKTVERLKGTKISTQHDFPIPWHKLDESVLKYLDVNGQLPPKEKDDLLKTVCVEYLQWEHRSSNVSEDTQRIAKQMYEIYPSSLSNRAFGKEVGKTESSHLADLLRYTVESFKRHERMSTSFKEADALDTWEEVANLSDSPILNRMPKSSSCPSTSECSVPSTCTSDGFTIPWHELDKSLLNNLKKERKLTHTQIGCLISMVSKEYLLWENKTSDLSEDTRRIAQHMCDVYPLSLSDSSFGHYGISGMRGCWYLAHLLWKRVDLITKQQSQYFKGLCFLDAPEMQGVDVLLSDNNDSTKSAGSPVGDCAPGEVENSTRGEFAIPWHKLDETLLDTLNKNKRLTSAQRSDLVLAVSEEFLQWNPDSSNIDQYTEQIAEQMCEIYPSSLSNAALGSCDGDTPGSTLACMLRSKVWLLRNSREQKSQSSSSVLNTEVPRLQFTGAISEMVPDPDPPCPDPVIDLSSPVVFDFGSFTIPWNKLDTSALNVLKRGKRLTKPSKINIVHVICNELLQWHPDIFNTNISETCKIISEKLVQMYPKSLSSAVLGRPDEHDSSAVLFNSFRSRFTVLKRYNSKKQTAATEEVPGQNGPDEGEADSGVLDWAINFRIPWEKMPQDVLNGLKNKERLSPSLKSELVRIVAGDIRKMQENPTKECVDYIVREMCAMYPKSLSDLSCVNPANRHDSHAREILWRINHPNESLDEEESKEKSLHSTGTSRIENDEPIEILDSFPCPPSIVEVELVVDSNSSSVPTSYNPSTEDSSCHAGYNYGTTFPGPYLPEANTSSSAEQHTVNSTPDFVGKQGIEDLDCGTKQEIQPITVIPDCSAKSSDNTVPDNNAEFDASPEDVAMADCDVATNCDHNKVRYIAEVVKSSDGRCATFANKPINEGNSFIFLPQFIKGPNSLAVKYPMKTYSRNTEAGISSTGDPIDVAPDCSLLASNVLRDLCKRAETHTNENPVTYQSSVVPGCSTDNLSLPVSSSYNPSPPIYPASEDPAYHLPLNTVVQPNPMAYQTDPSYNVSRSTHQSGVVQNCDTDDVIDMDTDQTADPVNVNSRSDNTYLQEPGSSSQGYNPHDRGYYEAVKYFQQLNQIQKPKEYE